IYWAMQGRPLPITGSGDETRDFTFVGDIVGGLLRAGILESAIGQEFNLASGAETRIIDLANIINARMRCPVNFDNVYVIETKGEHLEGSGKTNYKKEVFKLCNRLAKPKTWTELGLELPGKIVQYHWIEQDQWQEKISTLFA
ncbi:hypothetical protein IIC68_03350, partial [archaeon]|nr:hypothetical protein [archaeon]